jgi:hypothetical protein
MAPISVISCYVLPMSLVVTGSPILILSSSGKSHVPVVRLEYLKCKCSCCYSSCLCSPDLCLNGIFLYQEYGDLLSEAESKFPPYAFNIGKITGNC